MVDIGLPSGAASTQGGAAPSPLPRWRGYTLCTLILFGLWATIPKAIGDAIGAREQQIISTIGLLPVLLVLLRSRRLHEGARPSRGFWMAGVSGVFTGVGNALYYQAARDAALSSITPLTALYPFVTVLLAAAILKERWSGTQAFGILLALGAMTLFNFGGSLAVTAVGLLVALGPLLLWGAAGVLQKTASGYASGELNGIAFLAASIPMAGALLILPGTLKWQAPASAYALSVLLGLCLGLGSLSLLFAYRYGKASIITPLSGLYWIVTVPIGVFVFHERVGVVQLAALALTIAAVLALARERSGGTP